MVDISDGYRLGVIIYCISNTGVTPEYIFPGIKFYPVVLRRCAIQKMVWIFNDRRCRVDKKFYRCCAGRVGARGKIFLVLREKYEGGAQLVDY